MSGTMELSAAERVELDRLLADVTLPDTMTSREKDICATVARWAVGLLSLSEIEARLTPTVWREAMRAGGVVLPIEHLGDNLAARHRAWLDVILAALGKEQS